jgi:hypothetical protein
MSECKHECVILKRICIFILGVVIGFVGGYKYGFAERTERMHDRLMKQAEKPMFKRQRNKAPEPRDETFFEKKKRVPRGDIF